MLAKATLSVNKNENVTWGWRVYFFHSYFILLKKNGLMLVFKNVNVEGFETYLRKICPKITPMY